MILYIQNIIMYKMKTIKVAYNVSGVSVNSVRPGFRYTFGEVGEPIEMPENHAKKILKNSDFYVSDRSVKKEKKALQNGPKQAKTWFQELEEIKGIGKKVAEDIISVYPTKGSLLEAISKGAKIPFRDDYVELLKKEFIH